MSDIDWDLLMLSPEEYARREMKRLEEDTLIKKHVTKDDVWHFLRRVQEAELISGQDRNIMEALDPGYKKSIFDWYATCEREYYLRLAKEREKHE